MCHSRNWRAVLSIGIAGVLWGLVGADPGAAATVAGGKGDKIYLRYYYPVGVAGPLAKVMQEMVDEFNQNHDDVVVEAIYSGDYGPTTQKIITAVAAKRPPDVAITSMEDLNTLLAMNALVPLDEFIKQEGGKKFLDDFFPAFLANSVRGGKIWSWPFQRSLPLFYWNKEQFKEVGLDPNQPPQTWDELRDYARRLTVREGDAIKRYGVTISGGWNDWLFEAFVRQVGGQLMDPEGRQITFNSPQALEALDFWVTLSQKDKVMPPTTTWASTPPDFVTGRTSMLFHSSGILRFVKDSAKFPFGVGFLPKRKDNGIAVGGGNFYIFKDIPLKNQKAAWRFAAWMTNPENAARWSIASGYVAVQRSAYETAAMKEYTGKFPEALVARDQLKYAHARMSTANFTKVRLALTAHLDKALAGAETPKEALARAQQEALDAAGRR